MNKKYRIPASVISSAILILFLGLYIHNYFVDRQLERLHENSNLKTDVGIVEGEGNFEEKSDSDTAVIIIHGFTSSPSRFYHLRKKLSAHSKINPIDIYVPLLPYHGRSLEDFKEFDHSKIKKFVRIFLEKKRAAYKKIILIAESYGSLVLLDILKDHPHLKPEKLIFSSPALYLKANTPFNRKIMSVISPFMDYCTSAFLGCYKPYIVDKNTARHATHAKKHGVVFVNPTRKLFEIDNKMQIFFENLEISHEVILGGSDYTVGIKEIIHSCNNNKPHCSMSLYRGGHLVHWGPDAEKYENHILKCIEEAVRKNNNVGNEEKGSVYEI